MSCWDVEVVYWDDQELDPIHYEHVRLSSDVDLAEDGKHLVIGRLDDNYAVVLVAIFRDVQWVRFSFEEGPRLEATDVDGRQVLLLINQCAGHPLVASTEE